MAVGVARTLLQGRDQPASQEGKRGADVIFSYQYTPF
jgi:hypothetical protein